MYNNFDLPKRQMQDKNEQKAAEDIISQTVSETITLEEKELSTEKETVNESSFSRIWQEIAPSKTRQVREIIQIGEEKGQKQHDLQNSQQKTEEKQVQQSQQTVLERVQQIQQNSQKIIENSSTENHSLSKTNLPAQKQAPVEYLSAKQLFPNGQVDLEIVKANKQNARIFLMKKEEFFDITLEEKREYFKEVQLQAIQWLLGCDSKKGNSQAQNGCSFNIIRTVDLLYKKYIITPFKREQQAQTGTDHSIYDIYKPDPIYCEPFYSIVDNSIHRNHQYGLADNFKRSIPGSHYNEKYVSLIENESTNENQDYLEAIASNYINGIRKNRFTDSPNNNSQMQRSPISQGLDKFKKYGHPNSEISLPFDVQLNSGSIKRQFSQEYSHFQSTEDDKSDRFNQQRNVAKTFVKDGYGLQIVRNHLGSSMDGGTYNRAITTIIRDSYKKIQDFLTKTCNMKIHSLTSSEFSLVKTPLVHCRNILRPEDLNTFFKYIAITYKFGKIKSEEYPTPQETLSLYNAILRGLNDRKNARDQMHRPNRHNRDPYYQ